MDGTFAVTTRPGHARLEVVDEGTGRSPAVLARACEPLLSTRHTGRGRRPLAALGIVRGPGRAPTTDSSSAGARIRVAARLPARSTA